MASSFGIRVLCTLLLAVSLGPQHTLAQQTSHESGCTRALSKTKIRSKFPAKFRELLKQLEELPEGVHGEIVGDQIRLLPSGTPEHAHIIGQLKVLLNSYMEEDGAWIFINELDLLIWDAEKREYRTKRPDLMGWRTSRITREDLKKAPVEIIPDWIAEVASPETKDYDRYEKMPLYALNGVKYLWLVQPDSKKIEVFQLGKKKQTLLGYFSENQIAQIPPFVSRDLNLRSLWLDYFFQRRSP
jgi:Uma2 family endonuclease